MVFTLVRPSEDKRRRLKGANRLPLVVNGIKFAPGDAGTLAA